MKKRVLFIIIVMINLCGKYSTVQADELLTAGINCTFTLPESGTMILQMQKVEGHDYLPMWGPNGYGCDYTGVNRYSWSFTVNCMGSYSVVYGGESTIVTVNPYLPPATTYTVNFDADGGSPTPATQTIVAGGKATEPTEPSKSGFDFDGWYNGTTQWNFSTMSVSANLTLKAKWTISIPDANEAVEGNKIIFYIEGSSLIVRSAVEMTAVEIYNTSGQCIRKIRLNAFEVRITNLPTGIFIMRIDNGNNKITKKIVVRR
jgi:uncharacterized repeat protein (TIGR02543 family)